MTKYNIKEIKEKKAAYKTMVNPKLMDELKEKIAEYKERISNLENMKLKLVDIDGLYK